MNDPFAVTEEHKFDYYPKGVIFNIDPLLTYTIHDQPIFVAMDTSNYSNHYYFFPSSCNETANNCSAPYGHRYLLPQFVRIMNKPLLKQMEGIIDYYFPHNKNSGWLLLFNIGGRPKYCFEPEPRTWSGGSEDSSAQVRNVESNNRFSNLILISVQFIRTFDSFI